MSESQALGIEALLRPLSVALVGASPRASFASRVLDNLERHGYPGVIHLVNPKYADVTGRPCHASVSNIGAIVDLALIFVPASAVPTALVDCGEAGVRAAIIYASGFGEVGEAGAALQREIAEVADAYGIRVLGPNCQGLYFAPSGLAAAFTPSLDGPTQQPSGVAYVGQSGAVGGALMGILSERGVGLSAWASVGNQTNLTAAELMHHLVEQDEIRVLAAYLETVPDGGEWQRLTTRARQCGTTLVLLRSGRSEAGRRAASSHTGALVRPDEAFNLINQRDQVLEVEDVDELADVVEALAAGRHLDGPGIAAITSSGGAGCLFADQLEGTDLELARLSETTEARLAELVPGYGSLENPVDVTAQLFVDGGGGLSEVCRSVLRDPGVDALVVLVTSASGELATSLATGLADVAKTTTKQVSVVWLAGLIDTWPARQILRSAGVQVSSSVQATVRTLGHLRSAAADSSRTPTGADGASAPLARQYLRLGALLPWFAGEAQVMTEATGSRVLDALDIGRPPSRLVHSATEALAAGVTLGSDSFVLKIQSPQILHKTDVGGVRVGVHRDELADAYREVRDAAERVPGCQVEGILVQTTAPSGPELVLGVQGARDGYPAVVTVGFGGVAVELYADVASALAPITPDAALGLLRRLRSWPLLDGYRGRQRVDVQAAVDVVVAVASLADLLGEQLAELEINPLRVHPDRATALDLLIRTTGRGAGA